ncbi:MAG: glycosyltransferase, partial [Candidatus Nanopelagicaceae bacterium]
MPKNTLVIIPTFNESGFIGKLLKDLFEFKLDVLIVDDGSTDGTTELAKSIDTKG